MDPHLILYQSIGRREGGQQGHQASTYNDKLLLTDSRGVQCDLCSQAMAFEVRDLRTEEEERSNRQALVEGEIIPDLDLKRRPSETPFWTADTPTALPVRRNDARDSRGCGVVGGATTTLSSWSIGMGQRRLWDDI